MGKFFCDTEVVRVTFPDNEWVDVKEELSQGDQDYILNQMAIAESKDGTSSVQMKLGRMAVLERSVVAWSFVENGIPVPVTKENISKLRNRYRQTLLEKIDELNESASEFRKNSETAST